MDNTFASPIIQRPLEYDIDIVMHSATKYLNGHSDIIGGVVITSRNDIAEKLSFLQKLYWSYTRSHLTVFWLLED